MLAADLAASLDPVVFARSLGIDPDPWQVQALNSPERQQLFCCSRQSGKSTIAAILALHTALYRPGSLTLLVSRGERQSTELFRKVKDFYRRAGRPVPAIGEAATKLELEHGSRVVALPSAEDRIRGYSAPELIVMDEASRIEDEYFWSVFPMMATSAGRLLVCSTPYGNTGVFADLWHNADEGWERFRVPATECARITPAFLAQQRTLQPDWYFAQEYLCEFREDTGSSVFNYDLVRACVDEEVISWTRSARTSAA